MSTSSVISRYLAKSNRSCAQDEHWEESKHHRRPDGKFTSGGGRGKSANADEGKGKGKSGEEEKKDKGSEDKASATRAIISDAFRSTGGGLKSIERVNHHWEAKIDVHNAGAAYSKVHSLNSVLNKHNLSAKVVNPRDYNTLRIAQDEDADPINAVCGASNPGEETQPTCDAGTSEGAKKGWENRRGGSASRPLSKEFLGHVAEWTRAHQERYDKWMEELKARHPGNQAIKK